MKKIVAFSSSTGALSDGVLNSQIVFPRFFAVIDEMLYLVKNQLDLLTGMVNNDSRSNCLPILPQLQARIQNQLMQQPGLLPVKPVGKPTPLILDKEGRTVDNLGRTVQLSMRQPTLKVCSVGGVSVCAAREW